MLNKIALPALAMLCLAQQHPATEPSVFHAGTQEAVLDFVASDGHGRPVRNLRESDVQVLDDGAPQKLRSFRYIAGQDKPGGIDQSSAVRSAVGGSIWDGIHVVSIVIGETSGADRSTTAKALANFLTKHFDANTWAAVFALDQRLHLLQSYTNDRDTLERAIERATGRAGSTYAKDVEREVMKMNGLMQRPQTFQALHPGSAEESGPQDADRFSPVERSMAAMMIAMLTEQAGSMSIDALLGLIQAQSGLPGRKTVLFFSEGLIVPPEQPERLERVISAANRASVSFYTFDPSGLDAMSRVRLGKTTSAAMSYHDDSGPAVKPVDFQENMRTLATGTGGFAVANTNNFDDPLRRAIEEARAHYEVTYTPASFHFDGHFRATAVRVSRRGVRVRARAGYFALPLVTGEPVAPFEFEDLKLLDGEPPPGAFDFHAGVLTFRRNAETAECRIVFAVPARALRFVDSDKSFRLHVSFLALVRDASGQVVAKVSRDLPFEAPAARKSEFERGEVTATLPMRLAPGRYRVDAIANDAEAHQASVRHISLVPRGSDAGMEMSDVVVVRSVEPAGEHDALNPLDFSGGKIVPEMTPAIARPNRPAGIYFVVYPEPGAPPDVRVDLKTEGAPGESFHPPLPAPGEDGSLRIFCPIPFRDFKSGVFEIAVSVTKGSLVRRNSTVIELKPEN